MSTLLVLLFVLFILCNAIWLAAIVSAARADRIRMTFDQSKVEQLAIASEQDPNEQHDLSVKAKHFIHPSAN